MFLPIFLRLSNQNFLISILISVCVCLGERLGPYCLGFFLFPIWGQRCNKYQYAFHTEIRHFLSWIAYTSNKANIVGDSARYENLRWTLVGIVETGRVARILHYLEGTLLFLPVLVLCQESRQTGQNKTKFKKKFLIHVNIFVLVPWTFGKKKKKTTRKNETGMKDLLIFLSSVCFHFSQKHPVYSE